MASKVPIPQSDPNYLSPEECQEMFRDVTLRPGEVNIPEHHRQILEERINRYRKTGIKGTSFEEYEKKALERLKLLKRLMKG